MILPKYRAQVDLLLRMLPQVAKEDTLALNGGTAINLFIRDMPRLSVDLDLTYLPFDDRTTALKVISDALDRIEERLESSIPEISVTRIPQGQGEDVKLNCQLHQAQIKIEVNTTKRGHVYPVRMMQVVDSVQDDFGKFASINIMSHAELFGGKVCAALDRQHPRDLFDVRILLEDEGLSEEVTLGFIVSLLSHTRPFHELLRPNFLDQRSAFERQFSGMTAAPFSYGDYEATRERLTQEIHKQLKRDEKTFLLSFTEGRPDWGKIPVQNLKDLPAVRWKLANIHDLIRLNPAKHRAQLNALQEVLS